MKKKLCYILLILVVSFAFVNNVFAEEFSVSVETEKTVVPKGSEVDFMVNIKSSETIGECWFKLESDNTLEYVSVYSVNSWVPWNGVNGISLTNSNLSKNTLVDGLNVMGVKYKVNGDGRVVIKTLECSSLSDKTYDFVDIGVNFTVLEEADDTTISNITVSNGSVEKNGNQYKINLVSTSFGLDITTTNPEYKDDIVVKDKDGNVIKDIKNMTFNDPSGQGMMSLTVTVNNTTTYDVLVKYEKNEYDNSLKSLTINGKELQLKEGEYTYTYTVSKDVKDVEIKPVLNDAENFELSGNYSSRHTFSDDVIYVVVDVVPKSSSSGAKKATYNIEIKKEGTTNSGGNTGNSGSTVKPGNGSGNNNGNVDVNAQTGDVPMFLMGFILIISLFGSVVMYQKNLQGYK